MTRTSVSDPAAAAEYLTSDVLAAGFPSADLVGPALALFASAEAVASEACSFSGAPLAGAARRSAPAAARTPAYRATWHVEGLSEAAHHVLLARGTSFRSVGEGIGGYLTCSPGVVGLLAVDEARRERARAKTRRSPRPLNMGRAVERDATAWGWREPGSEFSDQAYVDPSTGEFVGEWSELPVSRRGRITEWSGKSRANMVRRMASTDWLPMFSVGVAPMVTVTYPGPWTAFAPTRADVGRHLEAFKESYRREFAEHLPDGKVVGAWKVEYQRRGAPHVHMLLPMPGGIGLGRFRQWVNETWHGIVWRDGEPRLARLLALIGHDSDGVGLVLDEHRARHLAAGTAVDLAEGVRCRDPRRIALYFLGHSLAHAREGGKEYQHRLPASYAGRAGRWWGVWGLPDATSAVPVDVDTWWRLRGLLGGYAEQRGRHAFQGGRMFGGWLAVEDGPAFLSALALTGSLDGAAPADPSDPLSPLDSVSTRG